MPLLVLVFLLTISSFQGLRMWWFGSTPFNFQTLLHPVDRFFISLFCNRLSFMVVATLGQSNLHLGNTSTLAALSDSNHVLGPRDMDKEHFTHGFTTNMFQGSCFYSNCTFIVYFHPFSASSMHHYYTPTFAPLNNFFASGNRVYL